MISRRQLYRAYWAMEKHIVPDLTYSQTQYEAVLRRYVTPATRWLDLGCGRHLLSPWRQQEERELIGLARSVVGIDLDFESLLDNDSITDRCQSSVVDLPFASESFSLVTANMVVEHLDDPAVMLRELHRQGMTVVIVTHDAGVARYAERRISFQDGRLTSDLVGQVSLTHAAQPADLVRGVVPG